MYRPRIVRLLDLIYHDSTRASEFWAGIFCLLVGGWMLLFWPVSGVSGVTVALDENIGSYFRGLAMTISGVIQILAAGTKWVWFRKWVATLAGCLFLYLLVAYTREALWALPTPFCLGILMQEFWVASRIWHDKVVNGSDRRRYHRDEAGHAIIP